MIQNEFPLDPNSLLQGLCGYMSAEGMRQELEVLSRAKAEVNQTAYDNWNGGTFYYCLHIRVLPSSFRHVAGDYEGWVDRLRERAGHLFDPYPNRVLDQVSITPTLLETEGNIQLEKEFIEQTRILDGFYDKLVNEINRLYAHNLSMSLSMLVRKLLENLIIDILRKKYGTSELSLYYDPSRGRFQEFSVLLKNLDSRRADFKYVTSSLDRQFIERLNRYRETGNSAAHSIDAEFAIERIKGDKDGINYVVQLLLRILQEI